MRKRNGSMETGKKYIASVLPELNLTGSNFVILYVCYDSAFFFVLFTEARKGQSQSIFEILKNFSNKSREIFQIAGFFLLIVVE